MRRLLNTLYVTTENAWVRKDGANVVVEADGAERGRVPAHMIGAVVCFSRAALSPALIGYCADVGIAISLHAPNGRFLARVEGPQSGNVLLRRAQHEATRDSNRCTAVASAIVAAKAANQRAVLRRALRDHGASMTPAQRAAFEAGESRLSRAAHQAASASDLDTVRGIEGDAASAYFAVFDVMIRREETELRFYGRSRRPPLDAPNALLSFLYALLANDCRAAAESIGLDPQMGFLHADRPGRMSLALDLMEEFRAPLCDRVALSLLNRGQIGPSDFSTQDSGAVLMREEARKTVLTSYQERKRVELRHPFIEETIRLGLFPFVQAQLLARHLRGDLNGYPPFVWK
jgi:CRISPR-associated protein Cas1